MSKQKVPLSSNQLLAAVIGGVFVVVAAFITGGVTGHKLGLGPRPTVTVTARVTAPAVKGKVKGGTTAKSGSTPGLKTQASLLPPVSQAGWSLAWHGTVPIGPQGVILTHSGPQAGNGNNFDLQYITGSANGWTTSGNAGDFIYWLNSYQPGPATINGIVMNGNYQGQDPAGQQARVGDRLCYEDLQGDQVAYLQVTRIEAGQLAADMWLWNKN